jgi:dGTP triphosphohydrolase
MNKIQALIERSEIESSKQFQRLSEKTQVLMPTHGLHEVAKTRFSHCVEVANGAELMVTFIAENLGLATNFIDHHHALFNVCLLHDIGHPPFGHDGTHFLSRYFKNKGLSEGFSDNNNNLEVIEKNKIKVHDYTLCSTIKYPDKLYSYQKEIYLPKLQAVLDSEADWFKNYGINLVTQKTTIACQIMDEADRNCYTCSDLADFFCLGNYLTLSQLNSLSLYNRLSPEYQTECLALLIVTEKAKKSDIKRYFNHFKNRFNLNYRLSNKGISVIDNDLWQYREYLNQLEKEYFIKPLRDNVRSKQLKLMAKFTDYVMDNKFYPSAEYSVRINESKNQTQKLRNVRNMIAEVSDWYIFSLFDEKGKPLSSPKDYMLKTNPVATPKTIKMMENI